MIYEVTEGKETVRVDLREVGEGLYDVTIEGETVRVDAVKSGRTIYSIIEDGQQFEAMVDERDGAKFDVTVRGQLFHLEAVDERTQLLAGASAGRATGPESIAAEMPGKIVKVDIAVGDVVTEGQGVVIIEAMKMENEIPSPMDGTITDVSIVAGDTVESGSPLFTVEPLAEE
jgi:biotin carboxyl carrier protein